MRFSCLMKNQGKITHFSIVLSRDLSETGCRHHVDGAVVVLPCRYFSFQLRVSDLIKIQVTSGRATGRRKGGWTGKRYWGRPACFVCARLVFSSISKFLWDCGSEDCNEAVREHNTAKHGSTPPCLRTPSARRGPLAGERGGGEEVHSSSCMAVVL